jgi:hypothetical protein
MYICFRTADVGVTVQIQFLLSKCYKMPSFVFCLCVCVLFLEVKLQGRKANHFCLVSRPSMVELYLCFPTRLRGILLNSVIEYRDNFTFVFLYHTL